jgi:hypothetical protein
MSWAPLADAILIQSSARWTFSSVLSDQDRCSAATVTVFMNFLENRALNSLGQTALTELVTAGLYFLLMLP